MNKARKQIIIYVGIVLAFLGIAYGFVPQVLSGMIVNQSDISGWQGMSHEMTQWNSAHPDDPTAWTESMFGGMPTTTIQAPVKGDWTQPIYNALLVGKRPATYLFISLVGALLLMLSLGISPLVAAGGAIAVTFCAYNLQIIQVGHNTKMQALAFLPWVLAALIFTYRKAMEKGRRGLALSVLGSAGFGLFLSFQVKANHPQITYYLALMIFIYAIALLVSVLRSKEDRVFGIKRFCIASALLLVLGLTGIGTNAIKLLPTYEYTPYSMRGGSTAQTDGDGSKGLKLDYATAWSYGWEELPNLLIPNFNGGSSAGAINPDRSETIALLREAGQPNINEVAKALPLYWGPQPFTAGPMYMGAITIFLFVLGLFFCKGKEKWWVVSATILAVLLGLGSHFMAFTRFFYDYVPFYNKFRTVSMALVVLQFTLPVLAFMVLDRIVKSEDLAKTFKQKGWIALAISGGFCLLCAAFPGIAGSFTSDADSVQPDVLVDALVMDRRMLLSADALRSLLFIAAAFGLLFWGCSIPGSAQKTFATQPEMGISRRRTAALLVCLLVMVDVASVGRRYLNGDHFVSPRAFQSQFNKRPVDEMILQDTDPSYRVLDLSVNVFNDSHPSYWHKNIGGYSPAKLQRYQEFIESHLTVEINSIYEALQEASTIEEAEDLMPYCEGLSQMNCRYVIIDGNVPPVYYRYAAGNAWFEKDYGLQFDDLSEEEVHEPVGSIELTSYAPNELRYSYSSAEGGRVVFSEVYYPKGWSLVTETGEELEIELYDDILRSAVVPAGEHSLVMRFEPASYTTGAAVSRACSILLILLALGSIAFACLPAVRKDL